MTHRTPRKVGNKFNLSNNPSKGIEGNGVLNGANDGGYSNNIQTVNVI
jgi:hypothetical protein